MASKERETGEILKNSDFLIIGDGEIGSKASQLIEKTPTLQTLGFHTPKRTILAEGFFSDFFQKSGLETNLRDVSANADIEAVIKNSSFSSEQLETLQTICRSYGDKPLVIRSSAKGDARGTGTYKSVFVNNDITDFDQGLKQVLASYFSPDAIAFRKDAATGEGFGVIIEPVIGHNFEGEIAPILSGFGYTSTSRGEGYLTIVPGLGCAVESRDGEQITKSQIEKHNGILGKYLSSERYAMVSGLKSLKSSTLLQLDQDHRKNHLFSDNCYSGKVFDPDSCFYKTPKIIDTSIYYPDDFQKAIHNLDLNPVFLSMEKMEQTFKKPQYFEWAMTAENGKPVFWIIQIADVEKKLDLMDFENSGDVMFMGHSVIGTGIKEASKIIVCYSPYDLDLLNRFNKNNKDYVLIFSSELITLNGKAGKERLNYEDFSNASVILELQDEKIHQGSPLSHFGGQLDMTGKLFGVYDDDSKIYSPWDLYEGVGQSEQEDGLRFYEGNFKIKCSEKENKIVIYINSIKINH